MSAFTAQLDRVAFFFAVLAAVLAVGAAFFNLTFASRVRAFFGHEDLLGDTLRFHNAGVDNSRTDELLLSSFLSLPGLARLSRRT